MLLVDHAAAADAPLAVGGTLHRISEGAIEALGQAAGLTLRERSDALRNANDDRTGNVFDEAIRGQTDRFVLVFEKPGAVD
jgi:predicted methyltransferase